MITATKKEIGLRKEKLKHKEESENRRLTRYQKDHRVTSLKTRSRASGVRRLPCRSFLQSVVNLHLDLKCNVRMNHDHSQKTKQFGEPKSHKSGEGGPKSFVVFHINGGKEEEGEAFS